MMLQKRILLFSLVLIGFTSVQAQNNVGIGITSPDSSAALHIEASGQGLLIPRMDSTSRKAISSPAEGLMVYDSTYQSFYYYTDTAWQAVPEKTTDTVATDQLSDADGDTRITLEESTDEDEIRLYADEKEIVTISKSGTLSLGKKTVILENWDGSGNDLQDDGGCQLCLDVTWQSFTLREDAFVEYIDIYFRDSYANVNSITIDVALYEGQGTSGNLLYQETGKTFTGFDDGIWLTIDVTDMALDSGKYSIYLSNSSYWAYSIKKNNEYEYGKPNGAAAEYYDHLFRVYGSSDSTYLINIDSSSLHIGDYTLPYTDGNTDELLLTDGAGNVSWQSLAFDALTDADGDTRIELEESDDADQIRLYISDKEIITLSDSGSVHLRPNLLTSEVMDSVVDFSLIYESDDQTCSGYGLSCTGSKVRQSFTTTAAYELDSIELYFMGSESSRDQITLDVTLYEGDGNNGAVLYAQEDLSLSGFQDTAWVRIDIPNLFLGAGEQYTLELSDGLHWVYALDFYNGGSSKNGSVDYFLRLYGRDTSKYVNINSDGLRIGNYTLPYTDGNAQSVLVTDGNGSISWQETSDDQTLSFSNNNLSIEDGNTLDLSTLTSLGDSNADTKIQVEAVSGANQLQFTTNDTLRMLIDSTGNVGIGTDDPQQLLHLALDNTDGLNIPLLLSNTDFSNDGGNAVGIGFVNALNNKAKGAIVHERNASQARGDLHILLDNAADSDPVDLDDAVATFTKDGKFGIATTEPDATFHLIGGFKYEDGNQSDGHVLTSDADGNASWLAPAVPQISILSDADGDTKIQVEENSNEDVIRFDVAGTQAMRINASRDIRFNDAVGIGTNSPTELLHIQLDNDGLNLPLFLHNANGNINDSNGVGLAFLNAGHGNPKAALFFQRTHSRGRGSMHILLDNEENNDRITIDDVVATFTKDGYVGIGTSDPINGKLEVIGSSTSAVTLSNYGYYRDDNFGTETNINLGQLFSIYADGNIGADAFYAHSDERMKAIIGQSNAAADLDILKQIKVTDYQYKDKVAMGNSVQKKVIAQELKAIYPQAVDTTTIKVVPDIYQMASIHNGWVALATDLKVGEQVQLLLKDSKALYEVEEVNAQGFKVASTASGAVFVYGRQVSNFHTVDYQAISMLNVSATQALVQRIEALKAKNQAKEAELNTWKTDKEMMHKRLAKLENLLIKSSETGQKLPSKITEK